MHFSARGRSLSRPSRTRRQTPRQQNPHRPIHRNPHHTVLTAYPTVTAHDALLRFPVIVNFLLRRDLQTRQRRNRPFILERRSRRPQSLRLRVVVKCPSHPKRHNNKDHRQRRRKLDQRRNIHIASFLTGPCLAAGRLRRSLWINRHVAPIPPPAPRAKAKAAASSIAK